MTTNSSIRVKAALVIANRDRDVQISRQFLRGFIF
jgi:hypothetical protein